MTLSYEYDMLGRPVEVLKNNTASLFTTEYDARGSVAKTTDVARGIVTSFLYDSIGRPTDMMERTTANVFKQLVTYRYDDASRITRRTFEFDFLTSGLSDYFTYDSNGLLSKMVPTNGDNLIPEYNNFKQIDRVKVEHDNNSSYAYYKDYTYKEINSNLKTNLPVELSYEKASDSTNLLTFAYTYDNMNNITEVSKNGTVAESYTYDDYGKLTGATILGNTYSYEYDKTGNITEIEKTVGGLTSTATLGYDTASGWRDRLVSVNGTAVTYSSTAPGLPVSYYNTKKSYQFTWNDLGQLYGGLVDNKAVTYQYNTDGLRTYKRANNQNHYYYYDGDRLIAEKLTTGYLLFYYDENDSIYSFTYNNGTTSTKYYLYKNLQGDVVQIRDKYNAVVANYSYDAWGNLVVVTDGNGADITSNTSHIAYINPIRYRGYYYDTETGFYYLQSRYYDPAIGRFISADSSDFVDAVASPETLNLFAYCGNNPVVRDDQGGQFWDTIFDVVSLVASVAEVISDPKDPMNWVGVVADTVDLIPFVSGVGEVTKAVATTKKVTEAFDDAHDVVKAADKAPIVIGENMQRVKKYAEEIGGHAYRPWKNDPFDADLAMKRNKRWINDMKREGREIIDIGPDFARRRTGYGDSPFYNMERSQLKGYSNYKKAFNRNGIYGGLPGEW